MTIPKIATYPMPSTMPANRVSWKPDAARAVLLVHDMQDYFLDFYDGAAAPVPELLAQVRRLRTACDAAGVPVVYTAQPAQQADHDRGLLNDWWGPGLSAQPQRAGIAAPLMPRPRDTVLVKWRYSAFVRSDLLQRMRAQGRDQLIICGVYAHIGCLMTAADAFMHDIQPFLVGDAVADFSAQQHALALDYVAQRCGVVLGARHAIAALEAVPASLEGLRASVAALRDLPAAERGFDDNMMEAGLDSIRLMSLVERWRRAGAATSFVELAERPTLRQWWDLLATQAEVH